MSAPAVTRILSDLHLHDATSWVRSLNQLLPLFQGVDHLILAGDLMDTQSTPGAAEKLEQACEFLRRQVPRVTFITGNHDPRVSEVHELLLGDGRIWVTHGDVFFESIAPWSPLAGMLQREIRHQRSLLSDAEASDLARQLQIHRDIASCVPTEFNLARREWYYRLYRVAATLFPPRQALALWEAWETTPRRANTFATLHRPSSEVVIFGHIHRPSVHTFGRRSIINTGSFHAPFGAYAVDWSGNLLSVRRIERRASHFHPGAIIHGHSLPARTPS